MSTTADTLTKLYVEITTACNLDCKMCVRHAWNDIHGTMPRETFARLIEQVRALPSPPTIHFGGFGEPLVHPYFLEFVKMAKAAGARVEVTTNGTLLTRIVASALIDLELDRLVVSVDGATAEHYDEIRVGSSYGVVVDNLRALWRLKMRRAGRTSRPEVGLAFVAMRSNIEDLPHLAQLATRVGAADVMVSNVIPHEAALEQEILYERSLRACSYRASSYVPVLDLPKMDTDVQTAPALNEAYNTRASISWLGESLSTHNDYCEFVQRGYAAVRWDGAVSPCLSLLHDHPEYVRGRRRDVNHHSFGSIQQTPLAELWAKPDYRDFRDHVRAFPFSPCTTCGGCERFATNELDCSGNTFPTCGGCLWAQGFVQCP